MEETDGSRDFKPAPRSHRSWQLQAAMAGHAETSGRPCGDVRRSSIRSVFAVFFPESAEFVMRQQRRPVSREALVALLGDDQRVQVLARDLRADRTTRSRRLVSDTLLATSVPNHPAHLLSVSA